MKNKKFRKKFALSFAQQIDWHTQSDATILACTIIDDLDRMWMIDVETLLYAMMLENEFLTKFLTISSKNWHDTMEAVMKFLQSRVDSWNIKVHKIILDKVKDFLSKE